MGTVGPSLHLVPLNRLQDTASNLSNVTNFNVPTAFVALAGVTLVEFCTDLFVVCVILHLAVVVELQIVTDRQTDTGPWLVLRMHSIVW